MPFLQSYFSRPDPKAEDKIHNQIFTNSLLFLNKGIAEIVNDEYSIFTNEQAIISCVLIQMSVELAMKAFLIKNESIQVILTSKFEKKSTEEIEAFFEKNRLQTRKYDELKRHIVKKYPRVFDAKDRKHLEKFQHYRNKMVHFNQFFNPAELDELKVELIYVIVHVIIKFLYHLNLNFETPSDFYREYLTGTLFDQLITHPTYVDEMCKLAKDFTGMAYECPECWKRSYSPKINLCFCCGLDFSDMSEYVDCISCSAKSAVIFDPLNIDINDNIMNGLCLNCGDKPQVFKCPECESKRAFWDKPELAGTCYHGCLQN